MGLPDRYDPTTVGLSSGSERRLEFGWMVGVVVHHGDALGHAAERETALHTLKASQGLVRHSEWNPGFHRGGDRNR